MGRGCGMNILYMVGSIILCAFFAGMSGYFERKYRRCEVRIEAKYKAVYCASMVFAIAFGVLAFCSLVVIMRNVLEVR